MNSVDIQNGQHRAKPTREGVETRGDECNPVQRKRLTLEAHDTVNSDDIVRSIWEHIAACNGAGTV